MATNSKNIVASSLLGVLSSAPFVAGFNEARAGKPFNPEAWSQSIKIRGKVLNGQWRYERGRMLALLFAGPLKHGQTVNRAAVLAYIEHSESGAII